MNSRPFWSTPRVAGAAALVLLPVLAGCSSSDSNSGSAGSSSSSSGAGSSSSSSSNAGSNGSSSAGTGVGGQFAKYAGASTRAVTYDAKQVPVGANVEVTIETAGMSTQVRLQVAGLQPGRPYGAHLHKKACGASPADAGGHYQNTPDPVQPSTNPKFANAKNEVWLDFRTDAHGAASSQATVPFVLRSGAQGPQSLVIHAMSTATMPGKAGTAGPRLACVTLGG
jgi:superoxide dismutase, Cu-Zn family